MDLPGWIRRDEDDVVMDGVAMTNLEQADDVLLLSTSRSGLQRKLDGMYGWCSVNFMLLNTTKSVVLVLSSRPIEHRRRGDFASVMEKHLNTTTSINYFSGSLERLGGPEWVYNSGGRKIYLCLSGRAGDLPHRQSTEEVGGDEGETGDSYLYHLALWAPSPASAVYFLALWAPSPASAVCYLAFGPHPVLPCPVPSPPWESIVPKPLPD
ncbi:hypothetical protein D9611_013360 [Ephemerocybe angulata]|uniref:Uncharacterized protein n=1 Tax=Ephemerocybe angulata TaxID=980116 RepID=A0A8H5CDV3_9AGAR|nr:hypothetical protein D9611_013360 [Tulosesus angulatus]